MREFHVIDRIRRSQGALPRWVLAGPGDDAAVLAPGGGGGGKARLLVTVDAMVEGVHFDAGALPPAAIGRRCAAAALSDIAAMGGEARWAVVSCGVPRRGRWTEGRLLELTRGIEEGLARWGAALVGGNLASSAAFFVSMTVGGSCAGAPMLRSGARPGDLVAVTGELGGAALGLELLRAGRRRHPLARRHAAPEARIEEGRRARPHASACIDVSDGFLQDLAHLLEESGVGAVVEAERLPLPSPLPRGRRFAPGRVLHAALAGGEDYELLLTVPPARRRAVEKAFGRGGVVPLAFVGEITGRRGVLKVVDKNGRDVRVPRRYGWDHFAHASPPLRGGGAKRRGG